MHGEWLEELAPGTSNVLAHVWRVQLLVDQTCWGFKWGSPCQGRDLRGTNGVLPGFDPSCTPLLQAGLLLFQEGFESFNVGHSPGRIQGKGVSPIGERGLALG